MEDTELLKGTQFTTPTLYDPKVKAQAYELYLSTDYSIADIGIACGVPKLAVAAWSREGNWRARKMDLEREELAKAEDAYRQVILANRAPMAERHIRISGKMDAVIEGFLTKLAAGEALSADEQRTISKLKQLAETLTGSSAVGARAVGLSDRPTTDPLAGGDHDGKKARQPLIVIGVTAQPVPGYNNNPVTINVSEQ